MRYLVLLLSLYLAAASATRQNAQRLIGEQDEESGLGIYDGTTTTIKDHPYLVRVYGEGYFYCAGSIVSESWVVTSAMCTTLENNLPAKLKIVAGSNGKTGEGTKYAVSQVVRHPDYNADNYDYSYSCIQIDGTFAWGDTIQPLLLPSADFSSGTYYTVAGWGAVDSDSETYNTLMEGTMKWMPKLYCSLLFDLDFWFLTDRQGCTLNKKKTTLCTGDIGDPFTLDGVYYGHFIYPNPSGDDCTSSAKAVLVSKIYPVVDWIESTTGATTSARVYGEGYFWSAGTIVSESWVVTSGETTTLGDNLPANFKIVAGSNVKTGEGTAYAVSQIVRHPDFNEDNYDYSYPCIQVDGTFTWGKTIQPLLLPSADLSSGTYYTVAGWGAVSEDSFTYNTLREGTMKWMPKLYCTLLYDLDFWFLTARQGCALNKKKTTLCTGDIGDPFTLDGVYYGHFIYPNQLADVCDSESKAVLVAKIYPVVDWVARITGATTVRKYKFRYIYK